jgi:hypothetical protein
VVPEDPDDPDVLASLARAVAVAQRRRRLRLGLVLMGALIVLVAMLLATGP